MIPEYIETRIRQPRPRGIPVVPGSTPVVAFGDVQKAEVATLGLNPSKLEFLDRHGNELTGADRRLETLSSLEEGDLSSASPDTIRRVFEGCNDYFQKRPYRKWFDRLEKILHPIEMSLYSGTACHLDLVQWAPGPRWGKLRPAFRKSLAETDLSFLRQQLSRERIRGLLLNGSGVVRAYTRGLASNLVEKAIPGMAGWKLFEGRTAEGMKVIGWNKNLQSSPGVSNEDIKSLGMAVAKSWFDG
jgi:hypothetical protein